jgi:predicted negative regulator of RcsB-dependent stress response
VSDYLSEEEQISALRRWWAENGTSLIVGLVVAMAAVVGWRWYNEHRQAQTEAASVLYQKFLEGRSANADVAETVAQLDADFPNTSYRVFTLFYRAADAAKADKYSDAVPLLEQAIASAPDSRLKDVARVRLAKVLAQLGEHEKALAALADVRGEGFRPTTAELKGDILMAKGDVAGARAAYQAAVDANASGGSERGAAAGGIQDPVLEAKLADATRADAPK